MTAVLKGVVSFVLLATLVDGTVPLAAQVLADVAKKEEDRRKTITQPAKVYTNNDLSAPPPSSTPLPAAAPAAPSTPSAVKDAAKDKEKEAKDKEPPKNEAYWKGRKQTIQNDLDRNQTYADALQTRINVLTADFVNRDDRAQRAVIERDRQKAIAELNRLKRAVADGKKALAALEEEARHAGVPPGWLR